MGIYRRQHFPQDEEKQKNKQMAILRRENHQLKREVSRLQKRLANVIESLNIVEDEAEPVPLSIPAPIGCPTCGGNLTHVSLPFGTLVACRCGYRRTDKNGTANRDV